MVVAVCAWGSGQTHTQDTGTQEWAHFTGSLREGLKEATLASFDSLLTDCGREG